MEFSVAILLSFNWKLFSFVPQPATLPIFFVWGTSFRDTRTLWLQHQARGQETNLRGKRKSQYWTWVLLTCWRCIACNWAQMRVCPQASSWTSRSGSSSQEGASVVAYWRGKDKKYWLPLYCILSELSDQLSCDLFVGSLLLDSFQVWPPVEYRSRRLHWAPPRSRWSLQAITNCGIALTSLVMTYDLICDK